MMRTIGQHDLLRYAEKGTWAISMQFSRRISLALLVVTTFSAAPSAQACSLMRVFEDWMPWEAAGYQWRWAEDIAASDTTHADSVAFLGRVARRDLDSTSDQAAPLDDYNQRPLELVEWEVVESFRGDPSSPRRVYASSDGYCWIWPVPDEGQLGFVTARPVDGSPYLESTLIASGSDRLNLVIAHSNRKHLRPIAFAYSMVEITMIDLNVLLIHGSNDGYIWLSIGRQALIQYILNNQTPRSLFDLVRVTAHLAEQHL